MTQPTRPTMTQAAAQSAAALLRRSGFSKACFQRQRGLRILCYHGVCADEIADQPWVPSYFVSASQFAGHLHLLTRFGPVVHLPDALHNLRSGKWDGQPRFAVTFDDVPACTFEHARKTLDEYDIRATFFVSTGNTTTGRLFNADVITLARLHPGLIPPDGNDALGRLLRRPAEHKRMSIDDLRILLDPADKLLRQNIDPAIVSALRPMNWQEVVTLAERGHDIGGHTVDHAILSYQTPATRRAQVENSVADIERATGRRPRAFAYPNGSAGDFGAADYPNLAGCGIAYAASVRPGFCHAGADLYALPRVCVDRRHTRDKFALEVTGMLDQRHLRQQGWR